MTRIKICGLTTLDDARAAAEFGADALGFIAVPGTPRFVSPDVYGAISAQLPPFVRRVVVARRPEDAAEYLAEYVQYYADTDEDIPLRRGGAWRIRAFRVAGPEAVADVQRYLDAQDDPVGAVLLDAFHPDTLGGAGRTFDWAIARQVRDGTQTPVILSGGLTAKNVGAALSAVRPFAVDVSSGVEQSPGVKDWNRVRSFVRAVRTWDLDNL